MAHEPAGPARVNGRRRVPCGPAHPLAGFSLVELLVVLALLILLTTLFASYFGPDHRLDAQKTCRANLQKIFLAMQIYADDNAEKFPAIASALNSEAPLGLLVPRYSVDPEIYLCPGAKTSPLRAGVPLRDQKISYAYYMGHCTGGGPFALLSDAQVNTNAKSAGDVIFSASGGAPGNNHGGSGGNVLFSDGDVQSTPAQLAFPLGLTNGITLLNPKPRG